MRYLSLFSGLEGASLAWEPLGWTCAAVSEIDPAACAVLAHHYPNIPNLGDVTKVTEAQIKTLGHIDIVVFGSPCQDVSIAGKRAGMKGARSGLFFTAMRIIRWSRARYALWENVPGVFSDNEGRGFAAVVGEMAGIQPHVPDSGWRNSGFFLGPDALIEWAVLDAQFFGVPQRRRRVFALRDSGDWQSRPPILLERESLCGHPAPSREAGQVAPIIPARSLGGGGLGTDFDCDGGLVPAGGCWWDGGQTAQTLDAVLSKGQTMPEKNRFPAVLVPNGQVSHILTPNGGRGGIGVGAVAIGWSEELTASTELAGTVQYGGQGGRHDGVMTPQMAVRRLTPREAERLQGVPDDYTLVPRNGKPMADGPRYKMLGNGFAVPVLKWIGEQIQAAAGQDRKPVTAAGVTESAQSAKPIPRTQTA